MRSARIVFFLVAAAAAVATPRHVQAFDVKLSLNAFPTNLQNPNGGGTWTLFAKTDAPQGIAAISAYLSGINIAGLSVEPDIAAILNGGQPFAGVFGGAVNIVYGQDTASGPIVLGVGTIVKGDGPDVLGDPAWNDATKIFAGTYSGLLPAFVQAGANFTDANVLPVGATTTPPANGALDANTTTVVRVFVPEPSSIVTGLIAVAGLVAVRRRR